MYQNFTIDEFFIQINTEEKARDLMWRYKYAEKRWKCSRCHRAKYYELGNRPEVRECQHCGYQCRLRVGTIFENSKLPLLKLVKALGLMMMSKRGVSALELRRQLKLGSYKSALHLLRKIRVALAQRDTRYKLEKLLEFDGAKFGSKKTDNQRSVLVALEVHSAVDKNGRTQTRAGFAKVQLGKEDRQTIEAFLKKSVRTLSHLRVDGGAPYRNPIEQYQLDSRPMHGEAMKLDEWLPCVHYFISNAKTWINGTHHGVHAKYLGLYLSEYTYRFNRRHVHDSLTTRALLACLSCQSKTNQELKLAA